MANEQIRRIDVNRVEQFSGMDRYPFRRRVNAIERRLAEAGTIVPDDRGELGQDLRPLAPALQGRTGASLEQNHGLSRLPIFEADCKNSGRRSEDINHASRILENLSATLFWPGCRRNRQDEPRSVRKCNAQPALSTLHDAPSTRRVTYSAGDYKAGPLTRCHIDVPVFPARRPIGAVLQWSERSERNLILYFAAAYPDEVVGMVYIDPQDPRISRAEILLTDDEEEMDRRDAAYGEAVAALQGSDSPSPGREAEGRARSEFGRRAPDTIPADPPVPTAVVLTTKTPDMTGAPYYINEEYFREYHRVRVGRFVDWAHGRPDTILFVTTDSGHFVHLDQPELATHGVEHVMTRIPN